jgi:hypothetical protein
MSKSFRSNRTILWLAGFAALLVAILVGAAIPAFTPTPGAGGPDIEVPSMENLPPGRVIDVN